MEWPDAIRVYFMHIRPWYFSILLIFALLAFGDSRASELAEDSRVSDAIYLLDRWIDAQRDYQQIPGISFAIVHDQEVLWSGGFGYADLKRQIPATPETLFGICSISKLFTSVAAMRLRDQGRFSLDDPVDKLLPGFKPAKIQSDSPAITVKGLLTHSSGLPNSTGYSEMPPFDYPSRDQIMEQIPNLETLFQPGQHENYSNLGLIMVGEIVARLSGHSYREYVIDQILTPLNLSSTVTDIGHVLDKQSLAIGYSATRRDGGRKRVEPFIAHGMAPALGFASTVNDLAKFATWQFRLLGTGQDEILRATTLREMQQVHFMDAESQARWGLGFMVLGEADKTFVGHGGFCAGYESNLLMQMDDKIATIALANTTMVHVWQFSASAHEILSHAIQAALEQSDAGKALPAGFEKYIGTYDAYPWGGEFQVIPWEGGIAIVRFPIGNPLTVLKRLKHIEGDTFRHVHKGDWLGDEYVFEKDTQGQISQVVIEMSPFPRVP